MHHRLEPKLISVFREGYSRKQFTSDFIAGVIVGILALPLAIDQFKDAMRSIKQRPRVLIIRMRNVLAIDASGLRALEDLLETTRRDGTALILSGVHAQPLVAMQQSGLLLRLGEENALWNIYEALDRARQLLGLQAEAPVSPAGAPPLRAVIKE